MTDKIKLYTSLPPKVTRSIAGTEVGTSYVAECVKSWVRANFEVISLNSIEEIRELVPMGYDVEYQEVAAERPRINDFLNAIRTSGRPIAGIINADIFLSHDPELLDAIAHHSAGGMVIVERINIDPVSLRPTGRSCYGFDALFFSTELLSRIDLDCEFLFGQPWWDYWFPLAYAFAGGRLMTVDLALLFHLDHPQKWNQAQWIANAEKTVNYFLRSTGRLPDDFSEQIQKLSQSTISESQLGSFAQWCFGKLRRMCKLIVLSPRGDGADLLWAFLGILQNPEARALVGILNEAQASIRALKDEVRLRENEISQILLRPYIAKEVKEELRILTSRKATLFHFFMLNVAWIRRRCTALAKSLSVRPKSS
jgi:hypothetical protein